MFLIHFPFRLLDDNSAKQTTIVDANQESTAQDISYAAAGYAPLTARLVQLLFTPKRSGTSNAAGTYVRTYLLVDFYCAILYLFCLKPFIFLPSLRSFLPPISSYFITLSFPVITQI